MVVGDFKGGTSSGAQTMKGRLGFSSGKRALPPNSGRGSGEGEGTVVHEPAELLWDDRGSWPGVATFLSRQKVVLEGAAPLSLAPGSRVTVRLCECWVESGSPLALEARWGAVGSFSGERWRAELELHPLNQEQEKFLKKYLATQSVVIELFEMHRENGSSPLTSDDLKSDLTALGLDSLAAIDIVASLERLFQLVIDDREIIRFRSIHAVLQHLRSRAEGKAQSGDQGLRSEAAPAKKARGGWRDARHPTAAEEHTFDLSLSHASHPLLPCHMLGGHPVVPLVDIMNETVARALELGPTSLVSLRLDSLEVRSPIVVREGRTRAFQLISHMQGGVAHLEWKDGADVYVRAAVSRREQGRRFSRQPKGPKELDLVLGRELYPQVLPHGSLLQCRFEFHSLSAGHFECALEAQNPEPPRPGYHLNPALMDGALQACALYALLFQGVTLLPRRLERWEWVPDLLASCRRVNLKAAHLGGHCFQLMAFDEAGDVVFRVEKVVFDGVEESQGGRAGLLEDLLTRQGLSGQVRERCKETFRDADLLQMHKEPEIRADSRELRIHTFFEKKSERDIFEKVHAFYGYIVDAKESGSYMYRRTMVGPSSARVRVYDSMVQSEREMIMMASNNYLDLANHPDVVAAAMAALQRYGYGAGSVPLLGGTLDIHRKLERVIAETYAREDAVVFTSGYSSNVGVMMSLLGENDLVVLDVYSHASLVDGAALARAHVKYFRHNDTEHLRQVLAENRCRFGGAILCVDGVFSMDGDLCPLPELAEIAREFDCRLLIDEAHAIGTVGAEGRGTEEHYGLVGAADIIAGTLSKAPAAVGGYIAASREVCEFVRHLGNPYVFSTALPPATAAGLIEAFRIMRTDEERRTKLRQNHEHFAALCRSAGFQLAPTKTPIVPVILGDEVLARTFAFELHEAGVLVSPVSFPAVAKNEARLRFGVMATHTTADIEAVFHHLVRIGKKHHVI